jgi:beta-glucanase (GH16 family)
VGGINGSGQIPSMAGKLGLIDIKTPQTSYTMNSYMDGSEMQLVFSDEFEVDGRTFYPGDDPYWEAVNLHYWAVSACYIYFAVPLLDDNLQTNNMEWYDPEAVTTKNGSLQITLSQKQTHDLNYQGGMISSWNKFCFTGGIVVASVSLPGLSDVVGLWPAVWTMGNLGLYFDSRPKQSTYLS